MLFKYEPDLTVFKGGQSPTFQMLLFVRRNRSVRGVFETCWMSEYFFSFSSIRLMMTDALKQAKKALRKEMTAKLGQIPEDEIHRQTNEVVRKVCFK